MPEPIQIRPDEFKPAIKIDAKDFTVDPSGDSPSVFDKPSVGQQVKRLGKAAAAPLAGMATAVGGAEAGGAIGGLPGAIVGAVIGGAAQPFVERGTQAAVTGQPYENPSAHEVVMSAVTNAAFTGLGKVGEVATKYAQAEDSVASELAKLPRSQRTVSKIKEIRQAIAKRDAAVAGQTAKAQAEAAKVSQQDLKNRDYWKGLGLSDPQIDTVMGSTGLQRQLAEQIEAGGRYKQAFQFVIQHQRDQFRARYDAALGKYAESTVDAVPLGKAFEQFGQGEGQHELSPAFRGFLQRKGLELTNAGDAGGPSVGGVPWKQLPEKMKEQIRAQGGAQGIKAPTSGLSIDQLRQLRTELRENIPGQATNLDRKAATQLSEQIGKTIDSTLAGEGATPEQIASMHAIDEDYGRFQNTIKALDPRSENYGQQVAGAIFDPMAKDPETAVNFIRMAKEADTAYGSRGIMGDLREAFLNKALTQARRPGEPFEELKALRRLQDQFGGDKGSRAVMAELFGADSPLAQPANFTKVEEVAAMPEPLAVKTSPSGMKTILSSPYFQGMITFGVLAGLSGTKGGGVFSALTGEKGPTAQIMAISAMLAGPPMISWVVKSGNSPLQRAMVGYLTNPNAANAVRYAGEISGAAIASGGVPPADQSAGK